MYLICRFRRVRILLVLTLHVHVVLVLFSGSPVLLPSQRPMMQELDHKLKLRLFILDLFQILHVRKPAAFLRAVSCIIVFSLFLGL